MSLIFPKKLQSEVIVYQRILWSTLAVVPLNWDAPLNWDTHWYTQNKKYTQMFSEQDSFAWHHHANLAHSIGGLPHGFAKSEVTRIVLQHKMRLWINECLTSVPELPTPVTIQPAPVSNGPRSLFFLLLVCIFVWRSHPTWIICVSWMLKFMSLLW